jgi:hypothetical protein
MGIAKLQMSDLNLFHLSKMPRIHDPPLARRSAPASTGKSIYHPTFPSTKMTTPLRIKPCALRNPRNGGAAKKFYKPQGQPLGRGIIHLFSIFFTPPVPPAVLPLPMSPLSFRGLPVTSLRLPVNSPLPYNTALLTTIRLPSPAPPTYIKPQTAPAATNLHQKQNKMASGLAISQKP